MFSFFLALELDSEYVWHIMGSLLAVLWKQFFGCYEFNLRLSGYFWGKLRRVKPSLNLHWTAPFGAKQ